MMGHRGYRRARGSRRGATLIELLVAISLVVLLSGGLMLGLGETNEEVMECLQDIYDHGVRLLTIGQYMAPTRDHVHTKRFVTPKEFVDFEEAAYEIGFTAVASGPLVRSSYRADKMVTA